MTTPKTTTPAITPLVGNIHIQPRRNCDITPQFQSRPCPHCGAVHLHGWPPGERPGTPRVPHCRDGGPQSDFALVPIGLYIHAPVASWANFPGLIDVISEIERNCHLKARVAARRQ